MCVFHVAIDFVTYGLIYSICYDSIFVWWNEFLCHTLKVFFCSRTSLQHGVQDTFMIQLDLWTLRRPALRRKPWIQRNNLQLNTMGIHQTYCMCIYIYIYYYIYIHIRGDIMGNKLSHPQILHTPTAVRHFPYILIWGKFYQRGMGFQHVKTYPLKEAMANLLRWFAYSYCIKHGDSGWLCQTARG